MTDFSAEVDSDGQAWPETIERTWPIGTDLQAALAELLADEE